jgi:hypothetical protein
VIDRDVNDFKIHTSMDASPPVRYGGSFMALLTALDTHPTDTMHVLQTCTQAWVLQAQPSQAAATPWMFSL